MRARLQQVAVYTAVIVIADGNGQPRIHECPL